MEPLDWLPPLSQVREIDDPRAIGQRVEGLHTEVATQSSMVARLLARLRRKPGAGRKSDVPRVATALEQLPLETLERKTITWLQSWLADKGLEDVGPKVVSAARKRLLLSQRKYRPK